MYGDILKIQMMICYRKVDKNGTNSMCLTDLVQCTCTISFLCDALLGIFSSQNLDMLKNKIVMAFCAASMLQGSLLFGFGAALVFTCRCTVSLFHFSIEVQFLEYCSQQTSILTEWL